ncbi:AlwI family type II restriction endonuclease (plasmid) [Helicobacter sp. NHP19-012]|uniref:AlwI family type II restriction endonuclease n=1 Tax=Helicobacter gastrofelis TaxID=2849642 RepID=A0ABN6IE25_9HELI|nr:MULTISPECIES: AlwI family type II restriction endonuclease [unclassified Helicobacter]BCZ20050.1 AlwI family type II restriction endonuclease [Helicobacter sp. NHP19-012]GMB96942.1 AlwI family type II restriction endonuclease [Helicobacter sp. NHP22-001]
MPKKPKYKILSFSTTMRNPKRIAAFLEVLARFENRTLTHALIMQIVALLIQERLYETEYERKFYKEKLKNGLEFNQTEIQEIIINSPQDHKEAGFEHGWESRFDTWYKLSKELGFCYYQMGKPLLISNVGHILINAVQTEGEDGVRVAGVFLNALMKYQRNNPFRRVRNENAPLPLLLNTMRVLKEKTGDSKIHTQEIPFLLCWQDGDHKALADYILDFRYANPHFQYSDDLIYEKALKLLESTNTNRFKKSQVCQEGVDDYIRKMRQTQLITLRGGGFFIDINTFESAKADYVIQHYTNYLKHKDRLSYFNYMGTIDGVILDISTSIDPTTQESVKLKTLQHFSNTYTPKQIFDELENLNGKKSSKDTLFKLIPEPTRLEFLTSIALKQAYKNLEVLPNYSVDDEGLPTSHASGGKPDILCYDPSTHAIAEVSLLCGRAQLANELIPIARHLADEKTQHPSKHNFALFIAPKIHEDCQRYARFVKHDENLEICNLDIKGFIKGLQNTIHIAELLHG